MSTPLHDATRAGVHGIAARSLARMRDRADALGFALAELDVRGASKLEVLERFAVALSFPDWVGRNWDALADALSDLSWLARPGYVVIVHGIDELRTQLPRDAETLLEILGDASRTHARAGVQFWGLLVREP
jgi:RNAse (barnase) inhibitor barstar